jgi:hypothetical protein
MTATFNWREYVTVTITDPKERRLIENTLDLLAQREDGRQLLINARRIGGGGQPIELRTDGKFKGLT